MLLKVIDIVREEMNRSGAQEILMPSVQPIELWQQTGRDVDYGQTMANSRTATAGKMSLRRQPKKSLPASPQAKSNPTNSFR